MRMKNILLACTLALLGSFANAIAQDGKPADMVGKDAPALHVGDWRNTNDKGLVLNDLKGKVVVLDFWAYW